MQRLSLLMREDLPATAGGLKCISADYLGIQTAHTHRLLEFKPACQ